VHIFAEQSEGEKTQMLQVSFQLSICRGKSVTCDFRQWTQSGLAIFAAFLIGTY
jgi:hypothetical protein